MKVNTRDKELRETLADQNMRQWLRISEQTAEHEHLAFQSKKNPSKMRRRFFVHLVKTFFAPRLARRPEEKRQQRVTPKKRERRQRRRLRPHYNRTSTVNFEGITHDEVFRENGSTPFGRKSVGLFNQSQASTDDSQIELTKTN